jgi:hypothetical protein
MGVSETRSKQATPDLAPQQVTALVARFGEIRCSVSNWERSPFGLVFYRIESG